MRFISVDQLTPGMKLGRKIVNRAWTSMLENGMACLNYFKAKGIPDLLIMDIDMPVMDGVKTVEKLNELGYKNMKVIFLTGVADKSTVLQCNRAGAKDYILKPVSPVYLRERVRIALDKNLDR